MADNQVQAKIDIVKGKDETGDVSNELKKLGSAASDAGSAATSSASAFSSFGNVLKQIGSIAAGIGLYRLAEQVVGLGSAAFSAATSFEQNTTALGTVLGNIGKTSDDTAENFAAAGGRMKNTARDIADEMRNYSEKIAKINDNLKDVLSGKNILD